MINVWCGKSNPQEWLLTRNTNGLCKGLVVFRMKGYRCCWEKEICRLIWVGFLWLCWGRGFLHWQLNMIGKWGFSCCPRIATKAERWAKGTQCPTLLTISPRRLWVVAPSYNNTGLFRVHLGPAIPHIPTSHIPTSRRKGCGGEKGPALWVVLHSQRELPFMSKEVLPVLDHPEVMY